MIKISTNRIFICGDTHAYIDFYKLDPESFPQGTQLTKQDYVIVCGDLGAVWDGAKSDKYVQGLYDEQPWTTLFIDGNHENHDLLDSYPISEWNGGKVHFITPSIIHLMRGQIYEIGNKKFFTMGGANSSDKTSRKEGTSWWSREMPSNEEYEEGLNNLDRVNNKVDYILTHSPSNSELILLGGKGLYEFDKLTSYIDEIKARCEYKKHFFGHMHINKYINMQDICLYEDIIEVK